MQIARAYENSFEVTVPFFETEGTSLEEILNPIFRDYGPREKLAPMDGKLDRLSLNWETDSAFGAADIV